MDDTMVSKVRKKRVAILGTRGIPARYGGFETFAQELAIGLVQCGIEITVFGEKPASGRTLQEYRGVSLRYVKAPNLGPLSTLIFDARCLNKCRDGFDLVYMLGYGAAIFCLITRLAGVETWINMDGVEWKRSKWSWLARIWLRTMEWVAVHTANRVIADAKGIRDHLENRYGRLKNCSVIPYGAYCVGNSANSGLLTEYGLKKGEYYLVVCRLEPENHVVEIIEGFLKACSRFPLAIIGNHHISTEYVQRIHSLSGRGVKFIGAVYDPERLMALRRFCRAYFHGHSVGGTNPSLLEAMGAENVIIAHDNVFNHEVLGPAGFYFRDENGVSAHTAYCDQMTEEQRQYIGSQVVERVRVRYTWKEIIRQYENLIKQTPREK